MSEGTLSEGADERDEPGEKCEVWVLVCLYHVGGPRQPDEWASRRANHHMSGRSQASQWVSRLNNGWVDMLKKK